MTDHRGRLPTKPAVGVPTRAPVHGINSPHVELLARLAVAGGILTTLEAREVCAAVIAYLEAAPSEREPQTQPC